MPYPPARETRMTSAAAAFGGPLPPPGAMSGLGMHYKMSYAREQPSARPPIRLMKPKSSSTAVRGHFDPDELSRRLYLVLADQRAHAERKRRAKEEAAKSRSKEVQPSASAPRDGENASATSRLKTPPTASHSSKSADMSTDLISELRKQKVAKLDTQQKKPCKSALDSPTSDTTAETSQYHHIPREAAKQFTRTTTVEGMRESGVIHKLSTRALRFHLDGVHLNRTAKGDPEVPPSQVARTLQREQRERGKIYDRNQFQRTRILEEAAEVDEERERISESQQRHTFQSELARVKPDQQQQPNPRRNSTGHVLEKLEEHRNSSSPGEPMTDVIDDALVKEPERPMVHEPRVDWTQSDEIIQEQKPLRSPLLRKADSVWTLKGRLGNKGSSQEKGGLSKTEETPKSHKPGFFAKFKR